MHPADIQAALKKKGITQQAIADALGVHPNGVSRVIHGKEVSSRIMLAIAKLIGQPVQFVFPDRYLNQTKRVSSNKVSQLLNAVND